MIHLLHIAAIASLSLFAQCASAQAASPMKLPTGFAQCFKNCPQLQQVGHSIVITLLDSSGRPFKAAAHEIDATGYQIVATPTPTDNSMLSRMENTTSAVTTQSASVTYETTTQYVVITFIFYYSNGKLIDVKTSEHRFPKLQRQ